jgi:hypothetical protein
MTNTTDSERIGAAIRAAAQKVEAPPDLRRRVTSGSPRPRKRRSWIAIPALGSAAAAVIAVVAFLALGSGGGPSVADAAGLALRSPDQPAPAVSTDERYLRAEVDGVPFPNYRQRTPFHTAGARSDEIGGRGTRTVIYGFGDKRIGYTIVAGKPLEVPAGAKTVNHAGREFEAFRSHGALVVTWRKAGHTCVIASRDASLDRLVDWAAET